MSSLAKLFSVINTKYKNQAIAIFASSFNHNGSG